MNPVELRIAAIKLFGERGHSAALAKALGVDLGSELPCYDGHNNAFEGYTTLFSVNGGRWRNSQIDRHFVDLDPTVRFDVEVNTLKDMNVAVETLREGRSGESAWSFHR